MTATLHEQQRRVVPAPAQRSRVPGEKVLRIHAHATAADDARRWLQAACRGFDPEAIDEAAGVLTVLVGNARRHGGGMITLAVEWERDSLAVALLDDARPQRVSAFRVANRLSTASAT